MNRIPKTILALLVCPVGVSAQDIPLSKILVEKEGWRKVAGPVQPVTFLRGNSGGEIAINYGGAHAVLTVKGDVLPGPRVLIVETVRQATTKNGVTYNIDDKDVGANSNKMPGFRFDTLKLRGLNTPTCLTVWPDEGHLVIGEADGAYLWAVRIEKDGTFGPGDRYYSLRTRPNEKMHVMAMIMDAGYLLYACTPIGIQVFDPTGRLSGVIAAPSKDAMTAITIGGAKADELFVTAGDKIYARRIQGRAAYTLEKAGK
jgi:hypothetical protein